MRIGPFVNRVNILRGIAFVCLTVSVFMGSATAAFALNTAAWTAPTPAAGSAVLTKPTAIFVTADDAAPIVSATVTLNGVKASFVGIDRMVGYTYYDDDAEEYYWVVTDYTVARIIGYFPTSRVAVGTNTVVTTVTSSLGVSTYTRTFTHGTAPTISSVAPASGAILAASPSVISASWTSATTPLSSSMTIDGVVVPTTYAAGTKTFTHSVATTISVGWHNMAFTARDSLGATVSRTWRFKVQPAMSTGGECDTCHGTYPVAHPVAGCERCHTRAYADPIRHGGTVPSVSGCMGDGVVNPAAACHQFDHTGDAGWGAGPFTCTDCHNAAYPNVAGHTDSSTALAHVSTTNCGPCHSESLVTEHGKYPAEATIKYQCDLCHSPSATQKVKDAIAAGNTACGTCHDSADHYARHDAPITPACSGNGCHASTNISDFHINAGTALTCESCHQSANPDVIAAIAGGDKSCTACHKTEGVDYHLQAAAKHASPTTISCFGLGCHDLSRNLAVVHTIYGGPGTVNPGLTNACGLCHGNPAVNIATSGASCTPACHSGTTHAGYSAGHTITTASAACTVCHTADLSTTHGAMANMEKCAICHSNPANGTKTADCASCHAGVDHELQHATTVSISCTGAECHSGTSLTSIHINAGTALTCDSCHKSVAPKVITAIASHDRACTSCHEAASPHGNEATIHAATLGADYVLMGAGPSDWDHGADWSTFVECSLCHSANLVTTHTNRCSVCHAGASPASSLGVWNKTCQQGACHPAIHTSMAPDHNGAYWNSSESCDSCHSGVPDWPGEVDCLRCH